ncbi:MAG: hypothetical protein QM778_18525 [Myxococcales bacterium]
MSTRTKTHLKLGAIGICVMALWALYGVAIGKLTRVTGGAPIRAQIEVLAMTLALIVLETGCIAYWQSNHVEGRERIARCLRSHYKELVALGLLTCLAAPLWVLAIIWLGDAKVANWIDLGSAPLFTVAFAWMVQLSRGGRLPRHIASYLNPILLALGMLVIVWEPLSSAGEWKTAGVIIAVVSGLGTALAAGTLSKLTKVEGQKLTSMELVALRHALPAVIVSLIWVAYALIEQDLSVAARVYGLDNLLYLLLACTFLNVVPNVLYVRFIKGQGWEAAGYLWALLPCFTTIVALFAEEKVVLSETAIIGGVLLLLGYALNTFADTVESAPTGA